MEVMLTRIFLIGLVIVALSTFSFAGSCALDSFTKSCNDCSFDESGKMDKECYGAIQEVGTGCLATTYPMMSLKYALGSCPHMDECVSRLSTCKELFKTGSDARDCNNAEMIECFKTADRCAEASNGVCVEGKTEKDAGFNNVSAGGTVPDKPINETKPPSKQEREAPLWDFVCGEAFILVGLLMIAIFVKNE
jgi:hypothetical protein